ncbi:hypothetical protein PA10_00284 [Pseudomonas phage pPa_SNUABM_DT01]|nr:hypothetical protein PA10_00284 [Pseudomonas phage pPa_SNUABM_DT01]
MCKRLGKKHFQYVGTDGLDKLKQDKSHWNPKRRLWDTYRVQILLAHTNLRDVYWNPQHKTPAGIEKKLTRAKAAYYAKLEKYYERTGNGK